MFNLGRSKITKKAISFFATLIMLFSLLTATAYAHNYSGQQTGVKALNCLGYEFLQSTSSTPNSLSIFFDKGLTGFDVRQIKIAPHGTTNYLTLNYASSGGCGWTSTGFQPGGTTITISGTGDGSNVISNDTLYDVIISNTITMGNSYHMTIGSYLNHQDVTFEVKTPNSDGTYDGDLYLSYVPTQSATGVGVSGNIEIIPNMPLTGYNLSNIKLQELVSGTYTDVIEDTSIDYNWTTGAVIYAPQINDYNTCIFMPETLGGGTTPSYDLQPVNGCSAQEYQLVIPSLTGASGSYTAATDLNFTTAQQDTTVSLKSLSISFSGNTSTSIGLSFQDIAGDLSGIAPSGYKVYVSTNPFWGFTDTQAAITHSGTTNTCTVSGLTAATTYYFRVIGVDSNGEGGGFSPVFSSATTN